MAESGHGYAWYMTMTEREQLEQAIAALTAQRATLGDAVVETALIPLRERLAVLTAQDRLYEQHRKHVTVLFADVSGFTALSDKMDAEEVGDTMNELWRRLDVVITAHGGRIDKHIGDAVMALWGVDKASEDDPERSIRAALKMQEELAAFRAQWPVAVAMRIGINTGLVVFGAAGTTGEITALGDPVNVASRLERAAPVDGILVSHDTYRHVRGVFDVTAQTPVFFKGKREPVRTYVIHRAKPRAFHVTTRGVEGIETRTIGREAEMAALQSAFSGLMQNAAARAVLVVGDPGVGKSRLAYDFENWLELLPLEVVAFKVRAAPEMTNVPYGLLRDLFRYRFEIFDDDSAERVRAKFEAGMGDHLQPEQAHLAGHLVGFDFSATTAVRNLVGSDSFARLASAYLTNYFRGVAAAHPAAILLEDLHWADDASLDFVAHLVKELSDSRLMVLCLTRPTLFERRPKWGGGPLYLRLDLLPLAYKDAAALVGEILQKVEDVPDDLRSMVVNSAEGNPFYVEELIKMLIDDGVIVRGDEHWRVEMSRLKGARVPPTLTGVLEARLDSLSGDEKDVLQRASVVGRLFWDATVADLHVEGERPVNVSATLEAVRAHELVFRHERSAFAGADEYLFKHAILHDVVYETVLLKLRRVYHRQVAAWLESHSGGRVSEFAGLIADHYERAGEAAAAAQWWRRSGEAAQQTSAYREAMMAYERALRLLPTDDYDGRAGILVKLGSIYDSVGDFGPSQERLDEVLRLARETKNRLVEAEALNVKSRLARDRGEYEEARLSAMEALVLARGIGDRPMEAQALLHLALVARRQADQAESDRRSEEARGIFNAMQDRRGVALCLNCLGIGAYERGDFEAATRHYENSLTICRELGDRRGIAMCLTNLGSVARARGDYSAAFHCHEDSLTIRREIGDRQGVAACLDNLGNVLSSQGDYAAASHYHENSLAIFRKIGDRRGIAIALGNLGHTLSGAGDRGTAWRRYQEALSEAAAIGLWMVVLDSLAGMARFRAHAGDHIGAAEWLGLALGHPASISDVAKTAEPLLAELRAILAAGELDAALGRGKALDLQQVVKQILAEPASSFGAQ